MKIISFICQKGGTSKTTLAVNLATEAARHGLETVLIDLDPQVSACTWKDIRGDEGPLVLSTPVPHLDRTLHTAKENGADFIFIDTAGRTNDAAFAAARVADVIFIPLQPSLMDLKTLDATMDIIRLSGNRPAHAVLSRVKFSGNRHIEAALWLQAQNVPVCPTSLGERVTYQDAYARGLSVTELDPQGKASQEIQKVYKYMMQLLDIDTSIGESHEKNFPSRTRVA